MNTINPTPFAFLGVPGYDKEGGEVFTAILKGSFRLAPREPLRLAEEQAPIVAADEFAGEPGQSPLRHENDLAPFKPACDLILIGSACAAGGRPSKGVEV